MGGGGRRDNQAAWTSTRCSSGTPTCRPRPPCAPPGGRRRERKERRRTCLATSLLGIIFLTTAILASYFLFFKVSNFKSSQHWWFLSMLPIPVRCLCARDGPQRVGDARQGWLRGQGAQDQGQHLFLADHIFNT